MRGQKCKKRGKQQRRRRRMSTLYEEGSEHYRSLVHQPVSQSGRHSTRTARGLEGRHGLWDGREIANERILVDWEIERPEEKTVSGEAIRRKEGRKANKRRVIIPRNERHSRQSQWISPRKEDEKPTRISHTHTHTHAYIYIQAHVCKHNHIAQCGDNSEGSDCALETTNRPTVTNDENSGNLWRCQSMIYLRCL